MIISLLLVCYKQPLKYCLSHKTNWTDVNESGDPLEILAMIERVVLSQTEDHYPFAVVFEHQRALLQYQQNDRSLHDYYEKFATKVTVGDNIGITYHHPALLEYCAQDLYGKDYASCTPNEKKLVEEATTNRYQAYIFMMNASHATIKHA